PSGKRPSAVRWLFFAAWFVALAAMVAHIRIAGPCAGCSESDAGNDTLFIYAWIVGIAVAVLVGYCLVVAAGPRIVSESRWRYALGVRVAVLAGAVFGVVGVLAAVTDQTC